MGVGVGKTRTGVKFWLGRCRNTSQRLQNANLRKREDFLDGLKRYLASAKTTRRQKDGYERGGNEADPMERAQSTYIRQEGLRWRPGARSWQARTGYVDGGKR